MNYLDHVEYKDYGFVEIPNQDFNRLLRKASDVIDNVTRRFYVFTDIEMDVQWRRDAFKKAVAAQIEYFHETGSSTSHGLNEPTQVTIGRTSIGGRQGSSSSGGHKDLISNDALMHLQGTGLLYRGVM